MLRGKLLQRIQPLPESRQTYRDDGYRMDTGPECCKIPHAAVQLFPVVESGAAHDLTVHGDPRFGEPFHDLQTLSRPGIPQHLHAKFRVGGMDGNIDGADAQIHDPLHFPGREVRQRHIVAQKKTQPRIIVLEIHGLPHPFGKLVDKAEDAVVGAGTGPVHQVGLKVQSQILAFVLADLHRTLLPFRGPEHNGETAVIGIELIVQYVPYGISVDGDHRIPGRSMMSHPASSIDGFDYILHSKSSN